MLSQLRPDHLQLHYTKKLAASLAGRTVRYHHVVVHRALAMALRWGFVSRNIADAIEPPVTKKTEIQFWNDDEVNRFLVIIRITPLLYTALFTGMRRSELLGLQ
jgi:integrase